MSTKEWLANIQNDFNKDWDYRGELESIKFTEEILENIKTNNIKKNELADRLKTTAPYVSKILNGNCNFTLKTIYRICYALDLEFLWKVRRRKTRNEVYKVTSQDVSSKQTSSIDERKKEANIYKYSEAA